MSIENAETEIARLRDRVKELETILQSTVAAHDLTKDVTTPSQGRSVGITLRVSPSFLGLLSNRKTSSNPCSKVLMQELLSPICRAR